MAADMLASPSAPVNNAFVHVEMQLIIAPRQGMKLSVEWNASRQLSVASETVVTVWTPLVVN